jgi:hypothetical protein
VFEVEAFGHGFDDHVGRVRDLGEVGRDDDPGTGIGGVSVGELPALDRLRPLSVEGVTGLARPYRVDLDELH